MLPVYVLPEAMDVHTDSLSRQMILLAHGSRDPAWCKTFEKGLAVINRHLDHEACLAYMEMATPDLETVIDRYYLRGERHFDIVPLFFAAGRHLLHDVPEQIETLQQRYPRVSIILHDPVGGQDMFWEALGILISTEFDPREAPVASSN